MNCVMAGRKIAETSAIKIARGAAAKTGAAVAVWVLTPAWAVAQIVQVWWDVDESSGCECVACTVPITLTRTTHSKHTALTNPPRFADIFSTPSRYWSDIDH
jgi:hypothetical protein